MKILEKKKVIGLRRKGMTISEIQKIVKVSKSSISLWMQDIKLTKKEQDRIERKITKGQMKSREVLRNKALLRQTKIDEFSDNFFKKIIITEQTVLLLCSCMYECEGGKRKNSPFSFTNSDPKMIRVFLKLLRNSFRLKEKKFRVHIHLHTYHNERKQLVFWSKITGIPQNQFMKTYIKKNSGMYKKDDYEGCITIRYYDVTVKRKLLSIFSKLYQHLLLLKVD